MRVSMVPGATRRRVLAWRAAGIAAAAVAVAGAALALAVASGAALAAGPGWPMRQEGGLLVVETPHYIFRTDHAPEAAQRVASQQEALFLELYRRMGKTKPAAQFKRMEVVLFTTQARFKATMGAEAEGSQGLFVGDRIGAWAAPDQVDALLETLRHEGTHQFTAQFIGPTCPVWLNEGLAVYFQNARFRAGGLETGQVPPYLLATLKGGMKDGKLVPLGRMLAMTTDEWAAAVRSGSPQALLQYPEAWAIVSFLEQGDKGKYRGPFLQYIHLVSRGGASVEAWQRTFGADVTLLESQWKDYIGGLEPTGGIDCRTKLRLIGGMVLRSLDRPTRIADIKALRRAALAGAFGGWTLAVAGVQYRIDDAETIADLFHCPEDTAAAGAISYVLVPDSGGGPPVVRCTHHAGYALETVYEQPSGGGQAVVQVVSRPAVAGARGENGNLHKAPAAGSAGAAPMGAN
ncbi:MAG: hypothetical protein IMZ66_08980 [Planctomycetes bacterium]|nr:hypothetical protein [Planctomycetota bacterium]